MTPRPIRILPRGTPRQQLCRWQVSRTWARLIREAEALWHVDVRAMHRIAAQELAQLQGEVPPQLRLRVNRWLEGFRVRTRLLSCAPLAPQALPGVPLTPPDTRSSSGADGGL